MYEQKKDGFSVRNVVIQFLFIALFIFILIWLFPMKSDLKKAIDGINKTNNSVLYDRIFNENIIAMKDAAKDYFTTPRLPKQVGDRVKVTLGDMLEQKIILPFADKNGDQCDIIDSYVEVTKDTDEFLMKVNLKCGEEENYLLVHMGCYEYCQTPICESNTTDVKKPIIYSPTTNQPVIKLPDINIDIDIDIDNSNNNNNGGNTQDPKPDPTPDPTPDPKPDPEKENLFEYVKEGNGHYEYTNWSEYTKTPISANATTAVRVKTQTEKRLVGYTITTTVDKNKPIYGTKILNIGSETILVCNKFDFIPAGSGTTTGAYYQYAGDVYLGYSPKDTATVKYVYMGDTDQECTSDCSAGTVRRYAKYVLSSSTVDFSKYACVDSTYKTIPLTTTVRVITGYEKVEKKEPKYEYREVKLYSYRQRKYIGGTSDKKWSKYNDRSLLDNGYVYTGNYKEI